ncbi:magnesium chelatase subunit H [Candidatus Chlorohelix sp.]|uniref:magnesium chelatase subunit H n=1 Tax=Candidatus Chlorohelix sp. TaxID=3139201 RepID=UPI003052BB99
MATQTRQAPRNSTETPKSRITTRMVMVLGMEPYNMAHLTDLGKRASVDMPGFDFKVFTDTAVEKNNPEALAAIKECDCFFGALIQGGDLSEKLITLLGEAQPKVTLVFESTPEAMELNRVGAYSTKKADGSKGEMPKPVKALANLLVKGREEDAYYSYIKLQKFTNRLMKFMPNSGKLADLKHWMTISTYWTNNCDQNVINMFRFIGRELFGYKIAKIEEPLELPAISFWHPDLDKFVAKSKDYLDWEKKTGRWDGKKGSKATVGILFFRLHLLNGHKYIADIIRALEKDGLRVLPMSVTGVEGHVAVRDYLTEIGVDFLISTLGFGLVGGPAGSTKPGLAAQATNEILSKLDVAYTVSQPLLVQDTKNWQEQGVNPVSQIFLYSLPEVDGAIAPVVLGGVNGQAIDLLPDRVERLVKLARKWTTLKRKANREKKIAILVYDYPTGQGNLATAALLDVPSSTLKLLHRLKADGYNVGDIPETKEKLIELLQASLNQDDPSVSKITAAVEDFYKQNTPYQQQRIENRWGAPPGEIAPAGRDKILLGGLTFGNVYVGVQPRLGISGDPMRLLFDKENAPHHQYIMFYRWLQNTFKADAVVHMGMHGTAEWLPGQQLGLTDTCWPDTVLGEIPSLYVYPLNNPSEANIAKRRGYSVIVSHAIPPYSRAGLYKEFLALKDLLNDWRDGQHNVELSDAILLKLDLTHLSDDIVKLDGESFADYASRVWVYLGQMEQTLITGDLHVLGDAPSATEQIALIAEALKLERNGNSLAQLALSIFKSDSASAAADSGSIGFTHNYESLSGRARRGDSVAMELKEKVDNWCEQFVSTTIVQNGRVPNADKFTSEEKQAAQELMAYGRQMLVGLINNDRELDYLLKGLSGGFISPGIGGDLIRDGVAVLPTGRNLHSLDPWRIPSDAAWERGRKIADSLIETHRSENNGSYPETIAQILWGLDTIKTKGEAIGTIIALMGARPVKDGQGKVSSYQLVPLSELGRPRIDVLMNTSGIFRDTFQMNIDLLDKLVRTAASADEPENMNFIRKHVNESMSKDGATFDQATARIFSQASGTYGTYVDDMVTDSSWESQDDLEGVYLRRNAYAYGGERAGQDYSVTMQRLLGTVERVAQEIDSVEYGISDIQHYYSASGTIKMMAEKRSGKEVKLNYIESFTSETKINDVGTLLRMEYRTKLLNPKWYESMLKYDHSGVHEISTRFNHMLGWDATTGAVDNWVYDEAGQTFVLDEAMRKRLEQANPQAVHNMTKRLLEAHGRGLWQADEDVIEKLRDIYEDLEDRLEGLV